MANLDQLVEDLSALTVLEAAELSKKLEEKWGVSAAAPVAVAAVAGGTSCRKVATMFNVSVAAVVKWSQRYRATGSAAAKPMGGRRSRSLAAYEDWLVARLTAKPDLTLRALVAELGDQGVVTSYGAVWRTVHRAGITFKKNFVRHRARPSRRRTKAQAVAEVPRPD